MPSKPSKEQWMDYFGLVSQLRQCAIWRWHTDGELTQSGREKPPRFVAVIDDPKRWEILVKRVEGIEAAQKRTKWPVQLFPEVWGWGKVSIASAVSSRRLQVGQSYAIVDKKASQERAETVAALLKAEGHNAYVEQTEEGKFALEVCAKQAGLSARWGYGHAYTLRAWDTSGNLLHPKLSVGVVVIRGIERGIFVDETPRKRRRDAAVHICKWGKVDFYQVTR